MRMQNGLVFLKAFWRRVKAVVWGRDASMRQIDASMRQIDASRTSRGCVVGNRKSPRREIPAVTSFNYFYDDSDNVT